MESYTVNVFGRQQGSTQQEKTFVRTNGPFLTITSEALPKKSKFENARFLHIAFDHTGKRMVAGDSQGNIYAFDLRKNKFWFICHLNHSSTAISFTPILGQDLIVALSDCSILCMDSVSKTRKRTLNNHTTCVSHISIDSDSSRMLSSSLEQAIVWDLRTFDILHNLTLKKDIDILKVFFLPVKNHIVSAFKDGSVFLWNSHSLERISNFITDNEEGPMGLKTIDGSNDGTLLVCGGRVTWILVWSVENEKPLYTISLANHLTAVRQLNFLASLKESGNQHFLSLLSHEGTVHLYKLDSAELVHSISLDDGKIISKAVSATGFKVAVISSFGVFQLYDMSFIFRPKIQIKPHKLQKSSVVPKLTASKEVAIRYPPKKKKVEVEFSRLYAIVREFGEYPERYRFFIWSKLLRLPKNEKNLNSYLEGGLHDLCFMTNKGFPIANRTLKRAFTRMMSMLRYWCPLMQEIDYMPYLVFPFVKLLHTNMLMCFELIITFIGSWCQNWFIFCPFPPYNILCVVENIISHHNRTLLTHFAQHGVTTSIYAWPLLYTGFSDVFNKENWLKLWDNIFSNPPEFILYVVAAYSLVSHQVLRRCRLSSEFKQFYQKHGVSVSAVIEEAYSLQRSTPSEIDPKPIIGPLEYLPKGGYPVFSRVPRFEVDFQKTTRNRILEREMNELAARENELHFQTIALEKLPTSTAGSERRISHRWETHLRELQKLQSMRRSLLLKYIEIQPTYSGELENKLKRIQGLIQKSLTDQIAIFDYEILSPKESSHKEDKQRKDQRSKGSEKFLSSVELEIRRFTSEPNGSNVIEAVRGALSLRKELVEEDMKGLKKPQPHIRVV